MGAQNPKQRGPVLGIDVHVSVAMAVKTVVVNDGVSVNDSDVPASQFQSTEPTD